MMRRAYRCAFLAFLLLIATRVSAQTDSKEPSGVIAGRVAIEDGPLAGVTVMATAGTGFQGNIAGRATTDDQGNYRIIGLAAGDYTINPFTPSFYYPSSQYYGPRGKSITLNDGEAVEGVDFKLTRGGVIAGKITDSVGKPVVEEQVQLALIDENHKRKQMPYNPYGFSTDDRGAYRIYGLEPGRYLVSVGRDVGNGGIYVGGSPHYYPLTYHPGVSEESRAEIVEISPGGEASSVDIVLGKTAVGYSARGHVVNSDTGQPASGVMVGYGIRRPDDKGVGAMGFSTNAQTGPNGEFRIDGVTPGRYAAFALPLNDGDFYSEMGPFEITDGDVEGVQVTVHKGGSISGVAAIEGNTDPAIAAKLAQLNLMARTVDNSSAPMYFSPKPIAPDGTFRITGLAPGKTFISLQTNSNQATGLSIARIEVNGIEQAGGIDVGGGQQVTGVRVVLSYGTGLIRGQVKVQGGTLPQTTSLRVSARSVGSSQAVRGAVVDSRGMFVIQGLADGEYEVTLMVVGSVSGRGMRPITQKVTVTQGAPAEAVMVIDLSKEN